jgi:hypothetical protein
MIELLGELQEDKTEVLWCSIEVLYTMHILYRGLAMCILDHMISYAT